MLYDGWSAAAAADIFTALLLWAALGTAMLTLMVTVRAQRLKLRADELREHELARADALTGLGNRRAFDEALDHEIARSRRAESTVSVLLIDVDRLKAINDRWGHVEGDRCLVSVAQAIDERRSGRRSLLPLGRRRVRGPALRHRPLRRQGGGRVAGGERAASCADADGAPLSVSIGPAEVSFAMDSADLVARADIELMARKRVQAYTDSSPPAPYRPAHRARGMGMGMRPEHRLWAVLDRVRAVLPQGNTLPHDVWLRRHRWLVATAGRPGRRDDRSTPSPRGSRCCTASRRAAS